MGAKQADSGERADPSFVVAQEEDPTCLPVGEPHTLARAGLAPAPKAAGAGAKDASRFNCPYPGCNRSFAELWRLKVHYRAPPHVRGSGKERGHGTELAHCPKCNQSLKPGKHHVGCSAGPTAPRQAAKRGRRPVDSAAPRPSKRAAGASNPGTGPAGPSGPKQPPLLAPQAAAPAHAPSGLAALVSGLPGLGQTSAETLASASLPLQLLQQQRPELGELGASAGAPSLDTLPACAPLHAAPALATTPVPALPNSLAPAVAPHGAPDTAAAPAPTEGALDRELLAFLLEGGAGLLATNPLLAAIAAANPLLALSAAGVPGLNLAAPAAALSAPTLAAPAPAVLPVAVPSSAPTPPPPPVSLPALAAVMSSLSAAPPAPLPSASAPLPPPQASTSTSGTAASGADASSSPGLAPTPVDGALAPAELPAAAGLNTLSALSLAAAAQRTAGSAALPVNALDSLVGFAAPPTAMAGAMGGGKDGVNAAVLASLVPLLAAQQQQQAVQQQAAQQAAAVAPGAGSGGAAATHSLQELLLGAFGSGGVQP